MKYSIFPSKSAAAEGQAFIRCAEDSVDEDGVISTKAGFIRVEADKAPALLAKLNEGTRTVTFGIKLNTGLYETEVHKEEVEVAV